MTHELLGAVEQVRARFAGGHARDAFELLELLLLDLLQLLLQRAQVRLAVGHALFAARQLRQLALDLLLRREDALLDLRHPGSPFRKLSLDLGPEPDRLLAGLDLRLAADRLSLAFGLGEEQFAHPPGRTHPGSAESTQSHQDEERREEDDPYDDGDFDEHYALLGRLRLSHGGAAGAYSAPGLHRRYSSVQSGAHRPRSTATGGLSSPLSCVSPLLVLVWSSCRSVGTDSENASYAGKMSNEAGSYPNADQDSSATSVGSAASMAS